MENLTTSLGAIANVLQDLQRRVNEQSATSSATSSASQTPASLALPSFNPENMDSSGWLLKIEGYKNEFGWSDRETVSRVGPFLLKSAQRWFTAWQPEEETWERFKVDFSVSFPKQRNLGKLLIDAVNYRSSDAHSYAEYGRIKLEKLKSLRANWSEADLIEIIAHSVDDVTVRTAAYNSGTSSVSDLIAFLGNYVNYVKDSEGLSRDKSYKPNVSRKRTYSQISASTQETRTCYNCSETGHLSRDCKKLSVSKEFPLKNRNNHYCRYCKRSGHQIENCFRRQNKNNPRLERMPSQATDNKPKQERIMFNAFSLKNKSLKTLPVKISGYNTTCLIDTGSTCSLINELLVDKLRLEKIPRITPLQWFDGTIHNSFFYTHCNVELPEVVVKLDLVIIPHTQLCYDIVIGENVYEHDVVLLKHSAFIRVIPRTPVNIVSAHPDVDIITDLGNEDKQKLMNLLTNFSELFTNGNSVKSVNTGELHISLTENKSIYYHPYRMSESERIKLRKITEDLMTNGIIRESNSPFASPVILVPKKNGADRLCVDYRALNKITVKDRYPLPRIDDQLDRLGKGNFFTSLDMAAGFHQIPVAPDSIAKTAFVTPDGQFEYLRMPFGLANAPATFQRAINSALGILKYNVAIVYMDDILIPSISIDDGLDKLTMVLHALRKANFSINISKCHFFMKTVSYLGREISGEGIRPGEHKIRAIKESPIPANVKQVRQFIGLASYFRKFIPAFSSKVACITHLTKNNVPFSWTADCEDARRYVIDVLTQKPLLSIFDPNLETQLHTDASSLGFGAILLQKHSASFRPVEYFSQKASPDESKYHSFELETLAVVKALKNFRVYLLGVKFTLVTDCNSLKLSANKKDLKPRVARWWAYMQDFQFEIVYRKGSEISHVDFLSRNPIETINQIDSGINIKNWLTVAQKQDMECNKISQKLNNNDEEVKKKYKFEKDTLFRIITGDDGKTFQLPFVPSNNRYNLLKIFHDDQCHVGWEKTLASLRLYFWFPSMTRYVKKYVEHCLLCAVRKNRTGPKQGFLTSIPKPNEPFHTIHADCLGPLPKSINGHKYILVVIDAFSKFCLLYPQSTLTADETKESFSNFLSIFGTPSKVIHDAGTNFTAKVFKSFVEYFGIEVHVTTPGTHRSNGQVERYMRTITNMLRVESKKSTEWPNRLWKVQLILNTTKQKTTGHSPFKLVFNQEGQTPQIRSILTDLPDFELGRSPTDCLKILNNLRKNAANQVTSSNKKRRNNLLYKVGDAVLLSRGQRSEKFDPEFVGPYTIKSLLSNNRYVLQKVGTRQTLKCSKDQIRIWPKDWTPDDLEYLLELNSANSTHPEGPETRNLINPGANDQRKDDAEEVCKVAKIKDL